MIIKDARVLFSHGLLHIIYGIDTPKLQTFPFARRRLGQLGPRRQLRRLARGNLHRPNRLHAPIHQSLLKPRPPFPRQNPPRLARSSARPRNDSRELPIGFRIRLRVHAPRILCKRRPDPVVRQRLRQLEHCTTESQPPSVHATPHSSPTPSKSIASFELRSTIEPHRARSFTPSAFAFARRRIARSPRTIRPSSYARRRTPRRARDALHRFRHRATLARVKRASPKCASHVASRRARFSSLALCQPIRARATKVPATNAHSPR